jgi:hypothetical protein
MKHVSSIVACALALAAASSSAQDSAKIAQGGGANTALIEQVSTAGNNMASVNQGEGWYGWNGTGNNAQLMQRGVGNSQIEVYQSGYNNQHMVYQSDGVNLQARINVNSSFYGNGMSEGNSVMIDQSGSGAVASVEQGGSSYSHADIRQQGWGGQSMADITQSGSGNMASVEQMGGGQASIYQSGSNLNASIMQRSDNYGYGMSEGNSVMIEQSGSGAVASVEQAGSSYSRADIRQQGWGGQSMADITQSGNGNMASVQQIGGGQASIYQSGSNLNASIMQRSDNYGYGYGNGNNATIRQGF